MVGRRNFSGCRIRERSALDNPRADVYNKDKERRCPRKRLAPHRHMVKKNDRHGWKRWAVISFCRYCHYRARSSLDNPRADVYNKDKERRCPCKRLAPHRHTVKKNDRHRLETVGGHFFLSLLPLSCEIRHAMSKVTCTT